MWQKNWSIISFSRNPNSLLILLAKKEMRCGHEKNVCQLFSHAVTLLREHRYSQSVLGESSVHEEITGGRPSGTRTNYKRVLDQRKPAFPNFEMKGVFHWFFSRLWETKFVSYRVYASCMYELELPSAVPWKGIGRPIERPLNFGLAIESCACWSFCMW